MKNVSDSKIVKINGELEIYDMDTLENDLYSLCEENDNIGTYEIHLNSNKCMKLYEVNNGYVGFGVVKCFVIAENEDRAIEIARHKYKAQSKYYNKDYYLNLTATCLCDNTSNEFVSEILDE